MIAPKSGAARLARLELSGATHLSLGVASPSGGLAPGSRPHRQPSRKLRSFFDRDGCRSFRSALASIWRMRSRVTAKS